MTSSKTGVSQSSRCARLLGAGVVSVSFNLAVTHLSVIPVQQSGPPTKARAARRQAEGPARTWLPSDRPAPVRADIHLPHI